MPALGDLPAPRKVLMIAGHAHPEHPALHTDRPDPPMALNKGILHFWPFAKYAVAFPRMSRSIVTRASSARRRLISICSARHPRLAATPFSLPSRCSLDPVGQGLLDHSQAACRRRYALARLHKSNRLLLELQRVPAPFPVPHLRLPFAITAAR